MSENSAQQAKGMIEDLVDMDDLFKRLDEDELEEDPGEIKDGILFEGREYFDKKTQAHYRIREPISIDIVKEVQITICTGGPAVQVVAKFYPDEREPFFVELQHQDWHEKWKSINLTSREQELLEEYVDRCTGFE